MKETDSKHFYLAVPQERKQTRVVTAVDLEIKRIYASTTYSAKRTEYKPGVEIQEIIPGKGIREGTTTTIDTAR